MTPKLEPVNTLVQLPATDVKRRGWRGIMRAVGTQGKVVVTNHSEPEAVVISVQEYNRLVQALNQVESKAETELEALRRRFDERLAALQEPDAGDRLRAVMNLPVRLEGELKAGSSY